MLSVKVIGAGLAGATAARLLADAGHWVDVYEREDIVGGMAADELWGTEVYYSKYGPHIFHTNDEAIWAFINRFGRWKDIDHTVMAKTDRVGLVPWPINLTTMKMIFGTWFDDQTIREFEREVADANETIGENDENFETKAVKMVGMKLYMALIKHYTEKQWGVPAWSLPAEILGRIRVSRDKDNMFFLDRFVCLPVDGYTNFVNKMLDHKLIKVYTGTTVMFHHDTRYDLTVNTASPDDLLDVKHPLEYRSVAFKMEAGFSTEGYPVINYCGKDVPYTRATNYQLLNGHPSCRNVAQVEYPGEGDDRLYPIRTRKNVDEAEAMVQELEKHKVRSCGRLGLYRYLNMDQTIQTGMDLANKIIKENLK